MIGRLETAPEDNLTHERHLGSVEKISRKICLVVEDDRVQGHLVLCFSSSHLEL